MTTCDAVGAHACVIAASIGYFIFALGWIFVALAVMRGLLDLADAIDRFRAQRSRSAAAPIPVRRELARVLIFPAKTRNRLVVR